MSIHIDAFGDVRGVFAFSFERISVSTRRLACFIVAKDALQMGNVLTSLPHKRFE